MEGDKAGRSSQPGDCKRSFETGSKDFGQNPAPNDATQVVKPGNKGGGGGSKSSRSQEAAKQKAKDKDWDDATAGLGEHNPEPVADPVENKPKAILKKVGWSENKTLFQSDAEIFADFSVPESEKLRTRVDFQLLIKEKGEFKIVAEAQGHCNADGHATAKVHIAKPKVGDSSKNGSKSADSKEPADIKAIFAIKAKHCTADWSKPSGTEREVTETAEPKLEHTTVSGIHFAKNKSFIAPHYPKVFRNLESTFKDWKKDRPSCQGHCLWALREGGG